MCKVININANANEAPKTRYDMYDKGLFVLITENGNCQLFDVCEQDEPNHLTVISTLKTKRAALRYAKENNLPIIYEML